MNDTVTFAPHPDAGVPSADSAHACIARFREQILQAGASGTALDLRGGATKQWYGQTVQGEVLDTRGYAGVIAYDPSELVITARCGTSLREIEALLAQHNQMLPFEPPHFGPAATLGGCIAAGLAGPRRAQVGAPRDFVLGAVVMNGMGQVLRFGGQVMKNVAGYDVARLMAGSLGSLGLILELSIKVLPCPRAQATLRFEMPQADAIRTLNQWGAQPLPISASAWRKEVLMLRLEGAQAAVEAAQKLLRGELIATADAQQYWQDLREQSDPFFAQVPAGRALWRISLPSVAEPLSLPGDTLIEWGGAQRWILSDGAAPALRAAAQQAGGHATLFRGGDKGNGVFTPLPEPLMQIHRGLKAAFDPANIFNRARMYPDF
jgi:glycolate oxidase FAD binding subunit